MTNKNADEFEGELEWTVSAEDIAEDLVPGRGFTVNMNMNVSEDTMKEPVSMEELAKLHDEMDPGLIERMESKIFVVGGRKSESPGIILDSTILPPEALEGLSPSEPGWFCIPIGPPLLGWQAIEGIGASIVNQKGIQKMFAKSIAGISMGHQVKGNNDEEEKAQGPDNTP